jgi:hypothetical protein
LSSEANYFSSLNDDFLDTVSYFHIWVDKKRELLENRKKPRPERSSQMTATTVKIIIAAEIGDRKVKLGSMDLKVDENLDEGIYQGMQAAGKALYGEVLQAIDDGIREAMPETWKKFMRG